MSRFYNICLTSLCEGLSNKPSLDFFFLLLSLLLGLVKKLISRKWKREPLNAIFCGILEKLVAHR